jgi:hypothetical protein
VTRLGMLALGSTVVLGSLALSACGGDVQVGFGGGGTTSTGGNGGDGASTSSSGGSTSSSGGSTSSTGGGGMGPCAIDCSTIATPACNVAACDEASGECVIVPDEAGVACDDGLFCSMNDACDGTGSCIGGPENTCGLGNPDQCELISCDEASQTCTVQPTGNGMPCTPSDLCIENGICQAGACVGQPKDCFFTPVPNECFVPACDPNDGQCKPQPGNDGGACLDPTDLCTQGKTCSAGNCLGGSPVDCSGVADSCNGGVCNVNNGQCDAIPLPTGTACPEGTSDCSAGACNGMGSCLSSPSNEGGPCNDGLTCTANTTCTAGSCGGGTSTVTTYFTEDFSDNAAGWTLDTEWGIGPAMVSSGQTQACGNADPGQDHSPSNDNGVAGVVIGGNASNAPHPFYYVTSPPVNTASASTLFLEFYRWLNSDYQPWMTNVVEVYDGMQWQQVFASGNAPGIQDPGWMPQSIDISAFSGPNLQVRFGFDIAQNGAYTCSGWNLDDVALLSGPCN